MMASTRISPFLPFALVPLVAWSKDLAVVGVAVATIAAVASPDTRREITSLAWRRSATLGLAIVLGIWATVTLAWAPAGAVFDWVKTLIVLAFGWCVVRTVSADSARAVVGATIGLMIILSIERISGGGLIGLVRSEEPILRRFDVLSAGLAFLCCLTFPAASIVGRRSRARAIGLVVVVGLLASSYYMDAAPIAVLAGIIAFGLVSWLGRRGFGFVVFVILIVSVAWGPLVTLAWDQGWSGRLNAMFGPNWGLRLDIWHRVDTLIAREPWLGQGFASGKVIGRDGSDVPFMHPHNGVLQLWLEMGLIGVGIFVSLVVRCARKIAHPPELPMIAATIAVVAVFWLVSFNLWASWWLAAQALTIAAATVAVKVATASPEVPVARGEG